jgi:glycerophosphoryl diester phosphodiesterase
MFTTLPRPAILAHRGASAYAPENTLAAFKLALEQSADGVELDAMLCADGDVVVIHDNRVDRTTDGSGTVAEMTLAELRQLDAGSWFSDEFKGERLPTLAEVFEAVGNVTIINVELKNYASLWDNLPNKAVELVRAHGLTKRVFFSSFNPIALIKSQRSAPEIPAGLLAMPGRSGALARSYLGRLIPHQALHPEFTDVTPQMIARAHRSGRLVNTYTVDEAEDMRRLFEWGIDSIITDNPRLGVQVRAEVIG